MKKDDLFVKSAMKVPPAYFDDFKDKLLKNIEISELLLEGDGLKVPEGYFQKSKKSILEATTRKKRPLLVWRYASAAVLAVLLVSSIWVYMFENQIKTVQFSDLTPSEIQHYFNEAYLEDKPHLILEQLQNTDLNNLLVIDKPNLQHIEAYMSEYDYRFEENY